ncbi:uncharacterized protein PV06_00877 [Exophiala oligosperma]|uniref:Fumarylacetoacetase N-terminal domain-containing protein n=1 Tax=Exophiala oligosperma TaxID=215243 RepID=A0A0D2CEE9_9EURO|nr:uncharacterized protein PV06_00877 [Exophiala oligosperma]KIW48272.1 hypothetical protein PV06_00877 [Exophiala oligosperma]
MPQQEEESKPTWLPSSPSTPDCRTTPTTVIRFGIMSSPTYPDPRPAIVVGDRVLNLSLLKKWDGFCLLEESTKSHLQVFDESDLDSFAALPADIRSRLRRYLQDLLIKDGPYASALQDKLLVRAAVVFPVGDVTIHPPFKADWIDATVL